MMKNMHKYYLQVVLDEVYQTKKERSIDTDSAESQVISQSANLQTAEFYLFHRLTKYFFSQPFECCEASKHKRQRKIDARHQKEKVNAANISIFQFYI